MDRSAEIIRNSAHTAINRRKRPASTESNGSNETNEEKQSRVCRVCGDNALSVNFNVITCESCKAFFRRNALKPKAFRCPFSGSCQVTVVSRKFCKKCRLRKCFEVGMMKEWIMSDEARTKKRQLISMNRDRRRATILATAAKHDARQKTEKREISDGRFKKNRECDYFPKGQMAKGRSAVTHDPLIMMRKSELIELMVQCGCSGEDVENVIDVYMEGRIMEPDSTSQTRPGTSQRFRIDPSVVNSFDPTDVSSFMSGQKAIHNLVAAQVQLAQAAMVNCGGHAPPSLTFLAPSVGGYEQDLERPLEHDSAYPPNVPTVPTNTSQCHQWTVPSRLMPAMALDVPSFISDVVNVPFLHNPAFSCSLPVRPAEDETGQWESSQPHCSDTTPPITLDHGRKKSHRMENSQNLDKLPFIFTPILQELLDAKKNLWNNKNVKNETETGETETEVKLRCIADFLKRITTFETLPKADKSALLIANYSEMRILHQLLISKSQMNPMNAQEIGLYEKCTKSIPKMWLQDDCIILILLLISAFNTSGCRVTCESVVKGNQKLYYDLLTKYLECTSFHSDTQPKKR